MIKSVTRDRTRDDCETLFDELLKGFADKVPPERISGKGSFTASAYPTSLMQRNLRATNGFGPENRP
jgi:hypothetical protein